MPRLLGDHLCQLLIDCLDVDHLGHLLSEHSLGLDAGDVAAAGEVGGVLNGVVLVGPILFLLDPVVVVGEDFLDHTAVLSLCEAVLAGTCQLGGQCLEGTGILALLSDHVGLEGILRLCDDEGANADRGVQEGGIGLLEDLIEAIGKELTDDIGHKVIEEADGSPLELPGHRIVGLCDRDPSAGDLGIGDHSRHGLGTIRDVEVDTLSGVLRHRDGGEGLLDLRLYMVHVDVSDDDDRLEIGAVPLVVVAAEGIVGEVHHDIHRADRHTMSVAVILREG